MATGTPTGSRDSASLGSRETTPSTPLGGQLTPGLLRLHATLARARRGLGETECRGTAPRRPSGARGTVRRLQQALASRAAFGLPLAWRLSAPSSATPNPHRLWVGERADPGKPKCTVYVCLRCWAYGNKKPAILREPCPGMEASRAAQKSRLSRGLIPEWLAAPLRERRLGGWRPAICEAEFAVTFAAWTAKEPPVPTMPAVGDGVPLPPLVPVQEQLRRALLGVGLNLEEVSAAAGAAGAAAAAEEEPARGRGKGRGRGRGRGRRRSGAAARALRALGAADSGSSD